MKKILLNRFKSKRSSNVDNSLSVDLSTERKLLPTDSISETIDSYEEYIKEKDSSDIFRLIFTVNPVCSNILFNGKTEVVLNEGSDDAKVYSTNEISRSNLTGNALKYATKYDGSVVNFIRDTAYSNKEIGGYKYHCGADIFNNHSLRRKEFSVVNDSELANTPTFNKLSDYMRDSSGRIIKKNIVKTEKSSGKLEKFETELHLYTRDSVFSFQEAMHYNLVESDGWVGFINPSSIDIPNVSLDNSIYTVNKCMNDESAGAFIDMYPGRELYSFTPRFNVYRKRLENNWDFCLTYPYEHDSGSTIVHSKTNRSVNGLRCYVRTNLNGTIFEKKDGTDGVLVYLRTELSNTFQKGDSVKFSVIKNGVSVDMDYPTTVEAIGYINEDTKHNFAVSASKLFDVFSRLSNYEEGFIDSNGNIKPEYEIIVRKYVNGGDCQYYLRKFRKIPNFNSENICVSDGVTEEEIENASKEFSTTINKLGFSENIFSDKVAQILYNEDVILTGLRDDWNRPLSEIYLTIVKRNAGHNIWYGSSDPSRAADSSVEYSHCFGEITSGFDLQSTETDYNVHTIHKNGASSVVENNITIDNNVFVGDIVEFSPNTVEETVIETVYHRFNTVQRDNGYSGANNISYDEILYDDYDVDGEFSIVTEKYLPDNASENIPCFEGYYYKPHYRVPIKQYGDTVHQGMHKKIVFSADGKPSGTANSFTGKTTVNYFLSSGDTLYLYHKINGNRVSAVVTSVGGKNYMNISFKTCDGQSIDIDSYNVFKFNVEMPDYAYDLCDSTGRYLWREPLSDSALTIGDELYDSIFTNGAHYRHTNINFYLRRQDPTGEYGLNNYYTLDYKTGAAEGKIKDVSVAEYEEEKAGDIC